MDHTSTKLHYSLASQFLLLLSEFLIPKQEVEDSSPYIPTPQRVFTTPSGSNNRDYSGIYPLGIEHAGLVEKGRDSDRERDQGQLEARALPEKIEKEAKKARGVSHLKKFEARASDGHHIDRILFLFIGLAHKSTLICFLFSF